LEEKFSQDSSKAYVSLQRALTVELERLKSLTAAFHLIDNLTQAEFNNFSQVLMTTNPDIVALKWIEVVPKNQRFLFEAEMKNLYGEKFAIKTNQGSRNAVATINDRYAVVKYVFPFEKNAQAIGRDSFSNEAQRQALYLSDITQSSFATSPQSIVQQKGDDKVVIIYHPVYSKSEKLKGYTALILNLNNFLSSVKTNSLLEKSLGLYLTDLEKNRVPFAGSGPEYLVEELLFRSYEFYLPFAGRNWLFNTEVNLKALPDYQKFEHTSIKKKWAFGIVFSFLFSLAMFLIVRARLQVVEANNTLKKQEKYYHDLIDYSSEAFYLFNCQGDILDVNAEACNLLGYTRESLLSLNINQIDVNYSSVELKDICKDLLFDKKVLFETQHKTMSEKVIPVEISASKFKINNENVIGAFVRDLTDRKTVKAISLDNDLLQRAIEERTQELDGQKRAFETIFEKSSDGIFISEGRRIVDCNQATVDIFGYKSKDQLLTLPNKVFVPKFQPDGESSHRKGFRMLQICLERGSHHFEWVNRRASGELFWTDVVLTRLEYYGRTVFHFAFRDISTRKRLESEMKAAREAAIFANKAKSEFLAKMTHDIRTPLHGILSYAQMGESRVESLSTEKIQRYFYNVQQSAQRLMTLLNDLLDSAKLESGLMSFQFQYQNIEPVIQSCLAEQASLIDNKVFI
jgi:PAS domain S-box-containing protein